MRPPRLVYVTDPATCPRDPADVAAAAVDGGADGVQVRGARTDREHFELARRIVAAIGSRAAVLVNARFDVALAAGAAGVHLKDDGLSVRAVREACSAAGAAPGFLVGASAHDAEGLSRLAAEGADLATIGPLHDGPGKPGMGASRLREVLDDARRRGPLPPSVLLLGGVGAADAELAAALSAPDGRVGLAAIRWFQDAPTLRDVTLRARALSAVLQSGGHCDC